MTGHVEFDAEFYLRQYADIRNAGVNPYEHFVRHGRAEGRLGTRPLLEQVIGAVAFDDSKATILIVSHEASLTGAPILSLNLVRGLQENYNVVSLLLGDGPLMSAFQGASVLVAGPVRPRHRTEIVSDAIAQLCELYTFRFALVNSVESTAVLEALARRSIPTVALIHEFASYTRPRSVFRNAFFWADEVVFSTWMTYRDAVSQDPALATKPFQILPQGRCEISVEQPDAQARDKELARVRSELRPAGLADDTLLVLGLGSVQLRKGVDLFIACASQVKAQGGRPCRFVWIGKGFDPENDLSYSVYLADQIRRAGLDGYVHFMDDTPEIEEVYRLADILLLTSRLDPLPNVAIDAMAHGLPLFCFANTTGIADALSDHGLGRDCVVPYLDTSAMAAKVVEFANSPATRAEVGRKLRAVADESFKLDSYIDDIHAVALVACEKVDRERESAQEIQGSGLARNDFLAPSATDESLETVRWSYVRPWTSGILPRKPFPGFHPGIYDELHGRDIDTEPLTHYLRAGRPPGPWHHDLITDGEAPLPLPPDLRIALHLHVYYPELLPEMLQRLERNYLRPDLLVSVPSMAVREQVEFALAGRDGKVLVEVFPNRGRDIGPLLTAFGATLIRDYDIVGHLHTKKTADVADANMADKWRHFLLDNLLGDKTRMADIILGRMARDPSIGIVFPDDPHMVGWGHNKPYAQALCCKLGMSEELPEHFVFPVGTMFWARVDALRPLIDLGLDWPDYPPEPLPYDGSLLHALERLLPFVVSGTGRRSVLTNVAGVNR